MSSTPSAPEASVPSQAIDLARYARAAARLWPVVAILTVLGVLGGVAASKAAPTTYSSSAVVQVNPGVIDTVNSGSSSAPNMDTEQQISLSSVVITEAIKHVPGELTVTEFRQQATSTSPKKASTLTLSFQGESPEQAQAGANALAQAYLAHRAAQSQTDLDRARKQIQDSSKSLTEQLAKAVAAANASKAGTADAARLEAKAAALNDQLTPVRAQLDRINSVVINPGVQISTAQLPTKSDGLSGLVFVIVGGFVGLLLALVLALALDLLRDRVRGRSDLARVTNAPVWAQTKSSDTQLPLGVLAALASRVVLMRREDGLRSLAITSVSTPVDELAGELAAALQANGVPATVATSGVWTPDSGNADTVTVVVAGAVETDARAAATAGLCDGTLLVVTRGDKARTARTSLETLISARAHVGGLFLDLRRAGARAGSGQPTVPVLPASADQKTPVAQGAGR